MLGPCPRPFFYHGRSRCGRPPQGARQDVGVISPLALEAVRRIDALFDIDRSINGQSAERRRAVRQEVSARWSPIWKAGCASSGPSCRGAMIWPKRWITCSNGGRRSHGSSMMAVSASRTMPQSERYAALQ